MNIYEVQFQLSSGRRQSPATVCLSADNSEQAIKEARSTVLVQEPSTDVITTVGIRTISLKEA